mmetsp:Transcript_31449/g.77101  ORF Transcript_31449/g.77101 Transcript_31449/m.77101 type:complete len:320 (+) Transcript_31449:628-1587(+)
MLLVCQVHLDMRNFGAEPWVLGHASQEDGLVGLHPHHQLIRIDVLFVRKQVARNRLELDSDVYELLVERFATRKNEGHPRPPGIVDIHCGNGIRGRYRIRWNRAIIQVADLPQHRIRCVLPNDHLIHLDGLNAPQHLHLAVPNVIRTQRDGRFHCNQRQQLQQMVLHDVPDHTVLVEVTPTALRADILLERNVNAIHVRAIPQGLKDQVGETECHDVLRNLFSKIVVDPEHLILAEFRSQCAGKLQVALRIASEGLLDHHAAPPSLAHRRKVDGLGCPRIRERGDREVKEAVRAGYSIARVSFWAHGYGRFLKALTDVA